ncbi:MAG: methyltransferase domain-containing protein [Desulfomicrobium sp.]|nr:methyltransferase domain-containing protein [Desulfomicrobium sp.]
MKHTYGYTNFFNADILESLNKSSFTVQSFLSGLNFDALMISEYNKKMLRIKFDNKNRTFQIYAYIISIVLGQMSKPLDQVVLVDYGGGSGIFSLLAKELGIGTVIYVDIYDQSCKDFQVLNNLSASRVDHIVHGDISSLQSFVEANGITVDAICSYDVIEHIYDIDSFFCDLSCIMPSNGVVVFGSGANIYNPLINLFIRYGHIKFEFFSQKNFPGRKERDSLDAYYDIRKNIIKKYVPELELNDVTYLARKTRGLIRDDIIKQVDFFKRNGMVELRPDGFTNTCDPETGNWAEHLISFKRLREVMKASNFSASILPGYWTAERRFVFIKKLLNRIIKRRILPFFISPYYVLVGFKK